MNTNEHQNDTQTTATLGRPPKQYSEAVLQQVADLAFKGCTRRTIANITGIDHVALTENELLRTLYAKKKAERRVWLKECQNKQAEKNVIMQIWLGKNELDQVDKKELSVSGQLGFAVNVIDHFDGDKVLDHDDGVIDAIAEDTEAAAEDTEATE